jgi:tripartite-type tricarboxylate transporter receptor subunit TctC
MVRRSSSSSTPIFTTGAVQATFTFFTAAKPLVDAGKVRVLAIAGKDRIAAWPARAHRVPNAVGVSVEAHELGVRRMIMAGVVPMNWLAVASEWQRDWARQDSAKALGELVLPHSGATGTAFAWELQLLGQKTGVKT